MTISDRLIVAAGRAIGLNLTYSNNSGGWSRGTPYGRDDVEFDPLWNIGDACEIAEKLGFDIRLSKYTRKKAMLDITLKAASVYKSLKNEKKCKWNYCEKYNYYETGCGHLFDKSCGYYGHIQKNGLKFCVFCGDEMFEQVDLYK